MKQISPVSIAITAFTSSLFASVDLSPVTAERTLDGITFNQLVFHENGRKITYEQPRGWKYSGGGNSITFTPPDSAGVNASIEQSPLSATRKFDQSTTKA